ncbi:uracil-DNA glycosylase [Aromatoleum petrolei]|uniref:Type-4 uracil-DNA glycosylase n=1 Tax=Aromatoleum petrolei TaxID=76116 RepID=A0ABX1MI20_9RHOO|nr:uracil-DNA glycosylase [Aromatoleum petrolei]NMF87589.1 uracil-DNA glycosylase [Aromatoleum petrolei]
MGLAPVWRLRAGRAEESRDQGADGGATEPVEALPEPAPVATGPGRGSAASPLSAPPQTAALLPAREANRARVALPPRDPKPHPTAAAAVAPSRVRRAEVDPARAGRIARMDWDELEADMRACGACRLCEKRRQAVPGVGDRGAEWMFVGEGPGSEEDQRGEPFVGVAGKLLDAMLAAIGLKRGENVYIANAVKCRPPHNRTPQADEIATCHPYLARQIELVRPRILIALGRPAALALLDAEISIGASRGRVFHRGDTPVVVTYHPAYLLRNQADKTKAWEDLCFARRLMQELAGQA